MPSPQPSPVYVSTLFILHCLLLPVKVVDNGTRTLCRDAILLIADTKICEC